MRSLRVHSHGDVVCDTNADCFHTREAVFPAFFSKVRPYLIFHPLILHQALKLKDDYDLTYEESSQFLVFLINCFQSLEDAMVREQVEKWDSEYYNETLNISGSSRSSCGTASTLSSSREKLQATRNSPDSGRKN